MIRSSLAVALVLALASFGCAAPDAEDAGGEGAQAQVAGREVMPSTRAEHGVLDSVWAIHGVASPDEAMVRVYEHSGGDPAMNGTSIRIAVEEKLFEIPSNIRSVEAVSSLGAGKVLVRGTEETLDEEGMPKPRPWEATFTYAIEDGQVSPQAEVVIGGQTSTVEETAGSGATFQTTVTGVHVASQEGMVARVFEVGVGDPAMNGANLLLALEGEHVTVHFDIGLDVRTVTSVAVDARNKTISITGSKDHLDADGNVVSRPFASRLGYGVDAEGTPTRVFFTR